MARRWERCVNAGRGEDGPFIPSFTLDDLSIYGTEAKSLRSRRGGGREVDVDSRLPGLSVIDAPSQHYPSAAGVDHRQHKLPTCVVPERLLSLGSSSTDGNRLRHHKFTTTYKSDLELNDIAAQRGLSRKPGQSLIRRGPPFEECEGEYSRLRRY